MNDLNKSELIRVVEWATGDDTGSSSEFLCRFMLGLKNGFSSSPSDSSDRGRCIRLLNIIPKWWDRLDELAKLPSMTVMSYGKSDGFSAKEQGWKEQIPLIKKEGNRL